jgi:hypothetical protein
LKVLTFLHKELPPDPHHLPLQARLPHRHHLRAAGDLPLRRLDLPVHSQPPHHVHKRARPAAAAAALAISPSSLQKRLFCLKLIHVCDAALRHARPYVLRHRKRAHRTLRDIDTDAPACTRKHAVNLVVEPGPSDNYAQLRIAYPRLLCLPVQRARLTRRLAPRHNIPQLVKQQRPVAADPRSLLTKRG